MKVLLLKEPRESESEADPYLQELSSCGHTASLIPVLSFRFVSLDELSERVSLEPASGIKFTNRVPLSASSSGSNEACIILIKLYFLLKCSVVDLGLSPLGEDTGTADALAQLILQRENQEMKPLFFPCGSIKREVLPTALRNNREDIY
uniref:Uroporphyrinogen III synthase n=1 Tax=Cyprinus carpio TaxID=7962 RepID=A0A8C2HFA8_CYPCA